MSSTPRQDPFSPGGISFTPVSPSLIPVRLISAALGLLPLLLAGVVLGLVVHRTLWALAGLALVVFAWLLWLVPRQVRALGYAEAADDLLIRRGIMFKTMSIVPYGRMQFVDVHQGPLDRLFGISQVQLHTAAATTDAVLPGLPAVESARLRDRLTARGEARLAGL